MEKKTIKKQVNELKPLEFVLSVLNMLVERMETSFFFFITPSVTYCQQKMIGMR